MPSGDASGDVVGVLDDSNNILLTGALADGTYTLKYEYEDGTVTEVGTIEVGEIPEPEPVKTNFADPTSSDWVTGGRISNGSTNGVSMDTPRCCVTNYIAVEVGDILQIQNCTFTYNAGTYMRYAVYSGTTHNERIHNNTYGTGDGYVDLVSETELEIVSDTVQYIRLTIYPDNMDDLSTIIINIKRNGEWL